MANLRILIPVLSVLAFSLNSCGEAENNTSAPSADNSANVGSQVNTNSSQIDLVSSDPKSDADGEIKVACIGEMADEPAGRQAAMAAGTIIGMVVPAAQGEGYEALSIFGGIVGCEVGREIARMLEKNPAETIFVVSGNAYMIVATKAGQKMLAYAGRELDNKEKEKREQKGQNIVSAATEGALGTPANPSSGAAAAAAAAAGVDPKAVAAAELAATPIPTLLDAALPGTPVQDGTCRVVKFIQGKSKRKC